MSKAYVHKERRKMQRTPNIHPESEVATGVYMRVYACMCMHVCVCMCACVVCRVHTVLGVVIA